MKIAAVTMVYNEAMILPYFLNHYSYLDEIHILYETDTTDESLEILTKAPNVVIEKCHIEGGLDDIAKINLMNKTIQNLKADWVYVVDPDEFIFPSNNEEPHDFLKRQICDVVRSGMFQVYRYQDEKDLNPDLPPIPQRVHGDPNLFSVATENHRAANNVYIKPNVVRPSKNLRFFPGHHQIEGNPLPSPELYFGAHWQMADASIAIARRMARKARISERNKEHQMGWQHYDISVNKIKEECELHLNDPLINELYMFDKIYGQPKLAKAPSKETTKNQASPASGTPNLALHKENTVNNFNILEHPICLSLPRRTVPFPSWRQHIPFAMLLVDILKPKTLVELGVHYGDSYNAFCQAIAELQLRTTCYGVDTWKGDSHASFYGSEVLADLKSHHDPLYGSFSSLIQSTFDDALQHFRDGSIDLLHIDGFHTYEAVKHDFETWLPKVSPRGIVLFHDISEKQTDFGVWKLWDELKATYPHFEFIHGHGLGLIAVGEQPPQELDWLLNADEKEITAIQNFFFSLGSRLADIHAEPNTELAAVPFSETAGDWLGARIKLEDMRAAQIELDVIRGSIYFQIAWKLRSLVNTLLPLGLKRIAERVLIQARTWLIHRRRQSFQEPSDKKDELAGKYLRGTGLAIGPLTSKLTVSPNITIDFIDRENHTGLSKLVETRHPAAAETTYKVRLEKINDETYDFMICDKFPDYLTDPVEALLSWLRVIKPGGILYLAIPMDSHLAKHVKDLQTKSTEIRVLDSAEKLKGAGKELIYVIEKANYTSKTVDMLRMRPNLDTEPTIDVIVPIYNAYEDVEKCIYSLFKHQDIYRVILVNDCSTDPRINNILNVLRKNQSGRLEIIENAENLGYLKTANVGMKISNKDVILLNSDTMVTSGWAKKIRACAYSRHCIATVTPFSNNGVECSIPNPGESNEIPEGFTLESFAELVERCSINRYPELVTAVGFCMYIRRVVIDEIGYLDEENFGLGYGEENDFSMRATRKGYKNVLCDNTFVFHKGGASFSHRRNALIQKSAMTLDKMYPDFWPAMHQFWRSKPLRELHNMLNKGIINARD